jgi:head-tail adaptor
LVIGLIRRRYSVRERSSTRDARGERSSAYTEKFRCWGETPREGASNLSSSGGTRQSDNTFRLRVRYRPGYKVGDQLVDVGTSQVLYIHGVYVVDPQRAWLQIVAEESPVVQTP